MKIKRRQTAKGSILKMMCTILVIAAFVEFLLPVVKGEVGKVVNVSDLIADDMLVDIEDIENIEDNATGFTAENEMEGTVPYFAYEQLSEDKKKVYAVILDTIVDFKEDLTLFPVQLTVEDYYQIEEDIISDHPEIFWYRGGASVYYDQKTKVVKKVEMTYCMTCEEAKKRQEEIDIAISSFLGSLNSCMSDYEITKKAYEFIISSVEYDATALREGTANMNASDISQPDDIRSIYGVFVNKKAVCAGYAKALQYILQHYNRECVYVWNDDHAWNLIKMGNDYYHVDATWGDGTNTFLEQGWTERINYDFLGLTTEELERLEDHTITNKLQIPECTSIEYNYHFQEGLIFYAYNYEQMKQIILNNLQMGNYFVTVKFANEQVYGECRYNFVDCGQISQMIAEINAEWGMAVDTGYVYYSEDRLYTLGIELRSL